MTISKLELKISLDKMVKKGYLKKTKKGYIDSDRVTSLLKKGWTRNQIAKKLEEKENGKE